MSDVGVAVLFLAAVGSPFVAAGAFFGWHWLTDRAWRQW